MSQFPAGPAAAPVRASDAERDQAAEILRAGYAEGRLTRAELDGRLGAAYTAKTLADLRDLTSDLPGAIPVPMTGGSSTGQDLLVEDPGPKPSTGMHLDWCPLLCLPVAFPPAGIAYWILAAHRQPQPTTGQSQPLSWSGAGPRDEAG